MPRTQDAGAAPKDKQREQFLIKVKTLELANQVRKEILFGIKPRMWVYVIATPREEDFYDIFVANEHGGSLEDERVKSAQLFIEKFLSDNDLNIKEEPITKKGSSEASDQPAESVEDSASLQKLS